ncbi:MAG: hypothetical protein ABR551_03915 [Gemmatimonadales bacterium]
MPHTIRQVEYFHTMVADRPGEALAFLKGLADLGINLLGFTAIPAGPVHTRLTIFPDDPGRLKAQSHWSGFSLEGPHEAFLVQGEDIPGALVGIHQRLTDQRISVVLATGVSAGEGRFGYLIHVHPDDQDRAVAALKT